MPGQRPILAMGFIASLGITLVVLACCLPKGDSNFWPMIVLLPYLLLPIPFWISKRVIKDTLVGMNEASASRAKDYATFFTAGILVCSFALPIILARTPEAKPLIAPVACVLVEFGNILCYITIGTFCIYFNSKS